MEDDERYRKALLDDGVVAFSQLGQRALDSGKVTSDFVIVCIDVNDNSWRPFVDELLPGHDWQQYIDRGATPVARGIVDVEGFRDYMKKICPDVGAGLDPPPPPDTIYVCVLAKGGATLYLIEFKKVLLEVN